MSIPDDMSFLGVNPEIPYIQPVMTSPTTWSNQPSFGLTVEGRGRFGADPWRMFNPQYSGTQGWSNYGDTPDLITPCVMSFEHPVLIESIMFGNGYNASPRYYNFYAVDEQGNEELLWHLTCGGYGSFTDTVYCASPRFSRKYKFTQTFNKGWGGWAYVDNLRLRAYYDPANW